MKYHLVFTSGAVVMTELTPNEARFIRDAMFGISSLAEPNKLSRRQLVIIGSSLAAMIPADSEMEFPRISAGGV